MKNIILIFSYLFVHMSMIFGSRDIVSEVYYFSARFYDSKIGRFISSDPVVPEVQSHKGLNHYSYVYNNPLKYKDPTGHVPFFQDTGGQEEPSTMSLVLDKALNMGLDILDMVADTGDYLIDAMLPPKVSQNSIYGPEPFVFDKEFLGFLLGTVGGGGKAGPLDDGARRLSKQGPKGKILGSVDLGGIQGRQKQTRIKLLRERLDAAVKSGKTDEVLNVLGAYRPKRSPYHHIDLTPDTDAAKLLSLKGLDDQLNYLNRLGSPSADSPGYLVSGKYTPYQVERASEAWRSKGSNYRVVYGEGTRLDKRHWDEKTRSHQIEKTIEREVGFQLLDDSGDAVFQVRAVQRWNGRQLKLLRKRLKHGS